MTRAWHISGCQASPGVNQQAFIGGPSADGVPGQPEDPWLLDPIVQEPTAF